MTAICASGLTVLDTLCMPVKFTSFAAYQKMNSQDAAAEISLMRIRLTKFGLKPIYAVIDDETLLAVEQIRIQVFGNSSRFGTLNGTEDHTIYMENYLAYLEKVRDIFKGIAQDIIPHVADNQKLKVVAEHLLNRFDWIFYTPLLHEDTIIVDTPLPILTPQFIQDMTGWLTDNIFAWAEVSHNTFNRVESI